MKKEKSRYSLWENIGYVLRGIAKWQPLIIPCTLIHALTQGLSVYVWLYVVKWIIGVFETSPQPASRLTEVFLLVVAASAAELVMLLASNLCDKQGEGRMHDVEYHFALFWTTKVWTMPFCMQEDPEVQKNIFKARRAINSNGNGVAGLHYWSNQMLPHLVRAVVALVLLVFLNPLVVALVLAVSRLRFALLNRAAVYEKEELENRAAKEQQASYRYVQDTADFTYGKDIRLFRMQKPLYALLRRYSKFLNEKQALTQKKYAAAYVAGDVLGFVQEGVVYGWLIYMALTGRLSVAELTLYLGSVRNAADALNEIFTRFLRICAESRHVTDFREFLESGINGALPDAKSSFRADCLAQESAYAQMDAPLVWERAAAYEFEFDHVSFRYPGAESYALRDLSLRLGAGEKLAVVGLNGAGKTTFVKLLCRLYEPTEGIIYLNGKNIAEYELRDYWNLLAPVFQEDESLAFSVAQNVSMQNAALQDREAVMRALHSAGLQEKIGELPSGADTFLYKKLNDEGIELSGGQKQKLMLARALYKDAPVLVLDEPTAALDAIAESESYENFNRMTGGRTTVYISHRLSSTKFCDHIAMFEDGRLIEYGTHEALMQKGAKYAQLFSLQAQYYTGEEACYA